MENGQEQTAIDVRKVPIWVYLLAPFGVALLVFLIWRITFVTLVENYELGFAFDRVTGKIERIEKKGWVIRMPFRYSIHTIDLRPSQLTINANSRVLNAKLVQFNPEGLDTFVEWHGRDAGDSTHNLTEILKCYAFATDGGKGCPFLTVLQDIPLDQNAHPSIKTAEKGNQ
ncbi:MAG: hypothetical protein AAB649_00070 [Patescibacteria group bacterium]